MQADLDLIKTILSMPSLITNLIISIAGSLIVILLSIVAFWLTRYVRSTDALHKSFTELNTTVKVQGNDQGNFKERCTEHTTRTTKKLISQGKRLDNHETRISVIESKG
jgi:hypothetical protein